MERSASCVRMIHLFISPQKSLLCILYGLFCTPLIKTVYAEIIIIMTMMINKATSEPKEFSICHQYRVQYLTKTKKEYSERC